MLDLIMNEFEFRRKSLLFFKIEQEYWVSYYSNKHSNYQEVVRQLVSDNDSVNWLTLAIKNSISKINDEPLASNVYIINRTLFDDGKLNSILRESLKGANLFFYGDIRNNLSDEFIRIIEDEGNNWELFILFNSPILVTF